MTCIFMHKQCGKDCNKYLCRAFFPIKTPYIDENTLPMCQGEEYETECLRYSEAMAWREEKRLKGLTEKCPFATNNRCGRPWEWRCDANAYYRFLLTPYEIREGTDDIPVRDKDGNIKFTPLKTDEDEDFDIQKVCLSGDPAVYTNCPHYIEGMRTREEYKKLKSKEKKE